MVKSKLGKYLLYAVGEIVLVVIGILIALQISNSNQKRIERDALSGHLQSIGKNIESDLKKAENINKKRKELLSKFSYIRNNIVARVNKTINRGTNLKTSVIEKVDVTYTAEALKSSWDTDYLNPNLGGFESLKSSGYLSKLQGKDIESLLSQYYNLVSEIALTESTYNTFIQNARIDFGKENFDGSYEMFQADYISWDGVNTEFRPIFSKILAHASTNNSMTLPYNLIIEYDNLISIGKELTRLISLNSQNYDTESTKAISKIFDRFGNEGYPILIADGYMTPYYSDLEAYSQQTPNVFTSIMEKHFSMDFPAMDWAVQYMYVGKGSIEQLSTKDFSSYKNIRIEMKGNLGGEQIYFSIKDETNPTDGSEAKVLLEMTDDWKWYEIPLTEFEGTNLEKLFMPAAFIFENDAASVSVRNVEYVK
ncbi:hypothetical protein [Roseivirga sp.]|uniref:hypothetical protein n=1 Tax=Roseivirga sp. TaxID=1964215 RepID=UPI003B8CF562